ncbi:MAG: hypothetical protein HUU25_07560 [Candidatus Sumerlaeia bacterium]|nr:hypothetical protein [Candidatus Sumerlaeia bacterium]
MDGSVYDGNSLNPRFVDLQGHPGRSGFDQDADFAMGYDTAGGSGLALAHAGGLGIGSPLVDAGSRDFLNDGFTSPHRAGGVFDEPDNPVAALDFMGRMDAGYHHFGRPRFPRQTVTQVGVPAVTWVQYTVGIINHVVPEWDAVGPDGRFLRFAEAQIDSNREIDIVSGHFGQTAPEEFFGEDFTVAVFPTEVIEVGPTSYSDPTPVRAVAVAGLPFRGTTGLTAQEVSAAYVGLLSDFVQSTPRGNLTWAELPTEHEERQASVEGYQFYVHDCLAVTACAVPARGDGDNAGTVYVAAVGRYSSHETDVQEFTYDRILVWRLRPDLAAGALFPDDDDTTGGSIDPPKLEFSPGGFGALQAYTWIPYLREHERIEILDVSLCANNDETDPGVYVSWIERRDGTARVRSQYVPDSLTPAVLGRAVLGGATEVDNAFTVDGAVAGGTHRQIAFDEVEQVIDGTQDSVGYTNSLDSDFDFVRGEPRLSYFDFHGAVVGTSATSPIGPRQAVLLVNQALSPISVRETGEFNLWYPKASTTASAFECYGDDFSNLLFTSLAVNHAGPASSIRAFSSYTLGASPAAPLVYDLWTQSLAVDGSGNDDWLAPAGGATLLRPGAPASDTLHYPGATYRFSGTPRYISAQDLGTHRSVTTNVEHILDESSQALSTGLYPHLATNAVNLVDTFACYVTTSGTGSREVTVIQVDP